MRARPLSSSSTPENPKFLTTPVNHRVSAFAFALHAQAVTAMNQFLHHGFGETMLDLKRSALF